MIRGPISRAGLIAEPVEAVRRDVMKSSENVPVCMPNDVLIPRMVRNNISGTKPPSTPPLLSVTANSTNNRIKVPMNFRTVSQEFHYDVTTHLLR